MDSLKAAWNSPRRKHLTDPRNIALYIFSIIVLAITWSGIKTVQANYELQKQISALRQQNTVLALKNQNQSLQNQFYNSNEYLDLAARQDLGLAAPGEQVLLVPKAVALKYVNQSLAIKSPASSSTAAVAPSKTAKNLEDWRDFLLGRKLFSN